MLHTHTHTHTHTLTHKPTRMGSNLTKRNTQALALHPYIYTWPLTRLYKQQTYMRREGLIELSSSPLSCNISDCTNWNFETRRARGLWWPLSDHQRENTLILYWILTPILLVETQMQVTYISIVSKWFKGFWSNAIETKILFQLLQVSPTSAVKLSETELGREGRHREKRSFANLLHLFKFHTTEHNLEG